MKIKSIVLIMSVLFSVSVFADVGNKAAPGTYQIIQDKKAGEVFTDELLYTIEANRHETKEVWINVTSNTQVRILPKSVINSPNFIPITEEIIDVEKYNYMKNYVVEMENNSKVKNKKSKKYETKY